MAILFRRTLLLAAAAVSAGLPVAARAADPQSAATFIQQAASDLSQNVSGTESTQERETRLLPLIDRVADVPGIARFCLGRFWNTASPQQQQQYVTLFRGRLAHNIAERLGNQAGAVSVTTGRPEARNDSVLVPSTITRPNNAPVQVAWLVTQTGSGYRIVDVMAEGVSMRLTQRNDYSSFLSSHGGNVAALIQAMQRQG
jgi:phospholipid transport system substrate-binding protein